MISTCQIEFKGSGLAGKTECFEVSAARDFADDGNQHLFLRITLPPFHYGYTDWNRYVDAIVVQVKNQQLVE